MTRPTEAEFDALKRRRDENLARMLKSAAREFAERIGAAPEAVHAHVHLGGGTAECYCACPDGPCQHEFDGWREFEDGRGGERVCKRCGMGAMAHDIRVAP